MTSKAFGLAQLGNAYSDGALSSRNKIINGGMTIDQRNAGAAVSSNNFLYIVDRWQTYELSSGQFSIQQSSTAPAGFTKSLLFTVTTTQASLGADDQYIAWQAIEGHNVADLGFGTAAAKTITASFWVRSSVTGTYPVAVLNGVTNRSYVTTFSVSAADTWEYKSVTIPGDTSGSWATDNSSGLVLRFTLGAGSDFVATPDVWNAAYKLTVSGATNLMATSGATFYITGVQLEAGDTATPFEHRSYGAELALCQRYFYMVADGTSKALGLGALYTASELFGAVSFPATMRATPTLSATSGTNFYEFLRNNASDSFDSLTIGTRTSTTIGEIASSSGLSGTAGQAGWIRTDNAAAKVSFSAEL